MQQAYGNAHKVTLLCLFEGLQEYHLETSMRNEVRVIWKLTNNL